MLLRTLWLNTSDITKVTFRTNFLLGRIGTETTSGTRLCFDSARRTILRYNNINSISILLVLPTLVTGGDVLRTLAVMSSRARLIESGTLRAVRAAAEILCVTRTRLWEFNFGVRAISTCGTSSILTVVAGKVAVLAPRAVHESCTRDATNQCQNRAQ